MANHNHSPLARRAGARIAASAAVTIGLAVWSVAELRAEPPRPGETRASGVLSQSSSHDGSAILTAQAMKPGDTASGSVTIANTGDLAGEFSLFASNLTDAPGPNSGSLSPRLELDVVDVTEPGAPATVYSGLLGDFGGQALGTWPGGAAHSYRFTVRFPDGGTAPSDSGGDNAYMLSSTSVQFNFTATAVPRAPSEAPTPARHPGPAKRRPSQRDSDGDPHGAERPEDEATAGQGVGDRPLQHPLLAPPVLVHARYPRAEEGRPTSEGGHKAGRRRGPGEALIHA